MFGFPGMTQTYAWPTSQQKNKTHQIQHQRQQLNTSCFQTKEMLLPSNLFNSQGEESLPIYSLKPSPSEHQTRITLKGMPLHVAHQIL